MAEDCVTFFEKNKRQFWVSGFEDKMFEARKDGRHKRVYVPIRMSEPSDAMKKLYKHFEDHYRTKKI
jgi:hypothetical protein